MLGLHLDHPICVASGMITDQKNQIDRLFDLGAAAVVTKTIYEGKRKKSDEKIRFFASGAVNSTTFSHRPTSQWLKDLEALAKTHVNIVVSVSASTPENLGSLCEKIADHCPFPLELGISCPTDGSNLKLDEMFLAELVSAAKSSVKRKFSVKLGANETLSSLATIADKAGASALSISDSLPAMLYTDSLESACSGSMGYSGPGIKPIVQYWINALKKENFDLPLFGIGGIGNVKDVLEYQHIGCEAVQIYTELMINGIDRLPQIISEYHEQIRQGDSNRCSSAMSETIDAI